MKPAPDPTPALIDRRNDIVRRRRDLGLRLRDGSRRVDATLDGGEDLNLWNGFWRQMLDDYEIVCAAVIDQDASEKIAA